MVKNRFTALSGHMAALCHVSSPAAGGGTGKSPQGSAGTAVRQSLQRRGPHPADMRHAAGLPPADHGQEAADENSRGGAFLRAIGVFGVDRGNSDIAAVKTSIQSLRDGWNLLVFPEGTRVKEPGSVDVKGGVGMMAIRSGVPLVPVFIGRTSACFTGCPSSSESPTTRYIPVGRERRRSISPTPRRSCVGPMRWEESNGRGKSSQKRRFLLRRGAGCEAGGGDSP